MHFFSYSELLLQNTVSNDGDTDGWQKHCYSCFLLKQNDVVLKQKDLSLELRSLFEKKNSMDFPEGHPPFAEGQHHFAEGEKKWKKFFGIPKFIILI